MSMDRAERIIDWDGVFPIIIDGFEDAPVF